MRKRYRAWRTKRIMTKYEAYAVRVHGSIDSDVFRSLKSIDQMIHGFLSDPSNREIGHALDLPKSSVHDSLMRLKKAGFGRGEWILA